MTPAAAAMLDGGACDGGLADGGLADGGKPFLEVFCASGGVAVRTRSSTMVHGGGSAFIWHAHASLQARATCLK